MSVSSTRSEFQPIRYDDLVCLNTHGLVWRWFSYWASPPNGSLGGCICLPSCCCWSAALSWGRSPAIWTPTRCQIRCTQSLPTDPRDGKHTPNIESESRLAFGQINRSGSPASLHCLRSHLPVRHRDLSQHCYDLLQLVPLHRHLSCPPP